MSDRPDLVVGASGLIGSCLSRRLATAGNHAILAVRRAMPNETNAVVVDFEQLPSVDIGVGEVATMYCALGTTLKQAGSQEAFERVDVDYVVGWARGAQSLGARAVVVVSSVGAAAESASFYLRCKARMEAEVSDIGIPLCVFLRPSLLLGSRQEFRLGERLSQAPMRLAAAAMIGPLSRYRPIPADRVAAAMIAAGQLPPGVHRLHYQDMIALTAGHQETP